VYRASRLRISVCKVGRAHEGLFYLEQRGTPTLAGRARLSNRGTLSIAEYRPPPQYRAAPLRSRRSSEHKRPAICVSRGSRHDGLRQADLFRLETLRSVLHDKGDSCSFFQRAVARRFNRRKMYEYILAVLPCKESKSLGGIKPFHSSCFFHVLSFLAMEVQEDRLRSTPIAGGIAVPGWECEGALGGLARFKRCTDFKSYLECNTKPMQGNANILCLAPRCK
jgi:hypothetical protein